MTKLYKMWANIKQRCLNENDPAYPGYGGRGITMCEQWSKSPQEFIIWAIYNGYRIGLDIDRINNNGNYDPSNCRFVSRAENTRNTRANIIYEYNGVLKPLGEWVEVLKLDYHTVYYRLMRGWDFKKSVEHPVRVNNNPRFKRKRLKHITY